MRRGIELESVNEEKARKMGFSVLLFFAWLILFFLPLALPSSSLPFRTLRVSFAGRLVGGIVNDEE